MRWFLLKRTRQKMGDDLTGAKKAEQPLISQCNEEYQCSAEGIGGAVQRKRQKQMLQ